MLDTITVGGPWPLRTALPPRQLVRLPAERGRGVRIRVDRTGWNVDYVEASLPSLYFGHNGRLLANQEELDAALDCLRGIVIQYAEVPPVGEWRLKRLDLCWNFDLPARPFIYAHASLRIPGLRSEGTLFSGGSGVSWRGAKSRFVVSFYDKSRKCGVAGHVLRAEVRLRGKHLGKRLPGAEWRQFPALWQAFRRVMASIPAIPDPKPVRDWQTAVGMEEPEVRNRIMGRLAERDERTCRRWRARMEAARMPGPFGWSAFLPEDAPPNPVHVPSPTVRRPG